MILDGLDRFDCEIYIPNVEKLQMDGTDYTCSWACSDQAGWDMSKNYKWTTINHSLVYELMSKMNLFWGRREYLI
jgi:hypothetical protein